MERSHYISLLRELCKIDGIQWIRLLYCYPEEIDDESDSGDEGRAEDLPLSGSSNPACK